MDHEHQNVGSFINVALSRNDALVVPIKADLNIRSGVYINLT